MSIQMPRQFCGRVPRILIGPAVEFLFRVSQFITQERVPKIPWESVLLQSKNHIIINAVTFQIQGNVRKCWMFDIIS